MIPPEDRERFLTALDRDVACHGGPVAILMSQHGLGDSGELADRYGARIWSSETASAPAPGVERMPGGQPGRVMLLFDQISALYDGGALHLVDERLTIAPDRDADEVRASLGAALDRGVGRFLLANTAVHYLTADRLRELLDA